MYETIGPFQLVLGGSILIFIISGLFVLLYYYYTRKVVMKELEQNQLILQHQKDLLRNEITIIENERKRIARDLHDEIGANLAYIGLNLNQLKNFKIVNTELDEKIELCSNQLNKTIGDVRRISHDLLPPVLEMFGLAAAVEEYINGLKTDFTINFFADDDFNSIDQNVALQLYRAILEIINNSLKHSGGKNLKITMIATEQSKSITIEDDGIGFDFEKMQKEKGLGLKNIISRLEAIDAHFKYDNKQLGSKINITLNETK